MRWFLTTLTALTLFVLFGTHANGISWKTFTDSRRINSMFDYDGEIWAGTGGGVLRLSADGDSVTKYTNSEGLGDNAITCGIAAGGYLWFGSDTGKLSRFDLADRNWKIFRLADRDGNGIRINALSAREEFLWVATDIGISKFDMFRHGGEVKETYRRLGGFTVEIPIVSISIKGDTVVAASAEGFALADVNDQLLQDNTHWKAAMEEVSSGFPQAGISTAVSFDAAYVVGTSSGLYEVTETDGLFTWVEIGLAGEAVTQIRIDGDSLVVTSTGGVYAYDGTSLDSYDLAGLPTVTLLSSLSLGGKLVVGTVGDGIFMKVAGWKNVQVSGPASNAIVDIDADSRGKIWTVVREPYLSSLDGDDWKHYQLPRSGGGQYGLVVDADDNVWVTTWGRGAFRLGGDSLIEYGIANSSLYGVQENHDYIVIRDVAIDDAGRIWFPCYRGHPMRPVSFYSPPDDRWDYYTGLEGLDDHFILSIHVIGDCLWTGYENAGLARTYFGFDPFDHSNVVSRRFTTADFLPSNNVTTLASMVKMGEDGSRDTIIWIGTNAGLARYSYDYGLVFRTELPIGTGPQVNAMEVDSRNNLWIGTTNALAVLLADGSGFDVFTTSNSLIAGNEITSILFDDRGYLWIGTTTGLSLLDYDLGEVTDVVEAVTAHPNPFIIPDHNRVYFNYDGEADVSIFTLAGELVRETSNSEGWDGRNQGGQVVASGMYIFYMVTPEGESHTGKIALIRK